MTDRGIDNRYRDLPSYHTVGVGAGPANLSLAALYQSSTTESMALYDKSPWPSWHPELLHPGARMQTSWLKDLVSLVDPTHKLSFLNYLVREGRLFALLNAQFDVIPRGEYMRYLAWADAQIDGVHHGVEIDDITFVEGEGFVVSSGGRPVARSEHVVIGVGTRPRMPAGLGGSAAANRRTFVADHLAMHIDSMRGDLDAPVAVVGGGQTGLEAVLRLLQNGFRNIKWLGRRQWFHTIDDSPVANDFYRPAHQQFLHELTRQTRRRLVQEQGPTGDACTPGALRTLYQANYDGMLALGDFPVTMLPGRTVTHGEVNRDDVVLTCTTQEREERFVVRHAVIAVGREVVPVPFSADLRGRFDTDDEGELIVEQDYSVRWKGPDGHRIYVLNRSRFTHGIPDANLTLLPVRAAIVLNSLFERDLYPIRDELCPISWG